MLNRTTKPLAPPRIRGAHNGIAIQQLCLVLLIFSALSLSLVGCSDTTNDQAVDPGPMKLDGTRSSEFEQDDLERADEAPDSVKEYCAGAASEAQRLGCESHVTEDDLP